MNWVALLASQTFQVALGVAVALIVYFITLVVLQRRQIIYKTHELSRDAKQEIHILDGYLDSQSLAYASFNTVDPFANGLFIHLPRSINRNGGAQFSYKFWMYMSDTTDSTVRGKDILLRGDIRKYDYEHRLHSGAQMTPHRKDIVVKCPRIRFGRSFKDFIVEFNTLDNVMDSVFMGSNADPLDTSMRQNVMSMMQNKWAMFTFTFEDNMPINDFENGIIIRMFVNDILFFTQRKRTTLRQNTGNLFLFPSGAINGCKMGGLDYMNYAVGLDEVRRLFRNGRPKFRGDQTRNEAQSLGQDGAATARPAYLGAYNKVNLYNI